MPGALPNLCELPFQRIQGGAQLMVRGRTELALLELILCAQGMLLSAAPVMQVCSLMRRCHGPAFTAVVSKASRITACKKTRVQVPR